MKQHITLEQVSELTRKGKDKLYKYFFDNAIEPNLLTIGQMIEYLEENNPNWNMYLPEKGELNKGDLIHKDDDAWWEERSMSNPYNWQVYTNSVGSYSDRELCDALWCAVKEDLEE